MADRKLFISRDGGVRWADGYRDDPTIHVTLMAGCGPVRWGNADPLERSPRLIAVTYQRCMRPAILDDGTEVVVYREATNG